MNKNKQFTLEEIHKKTNLIFLSYVEHYKADKMSFAEYILIENLILKIQGAFSEDDGDDVE